MFEINTFLLEKLGILRDLPFVGVFSDGPILFIPLFLSGYWLYLTFYKTDTKNTRAQLLHIFYACLVGIVFSYIIKQFVDIERPDQYLESTKNLILSTIPEKSFPSDHATVSFAFVTALFFTGFKKLGYIFLPFVIVMNISRILVGVHWPLDILAGTFVGIFSAWLFFTQLTEIKLVKTIDSFIIQLMKYIKLY